MELYPSATVPNPDRGILLKNQIVPRSHRFYDQKILYLWVVFLLQEFAVAI